MEPSRDIGPKNSTLQTLHMPTNVGFALQHFAIVNLLFLRLVLVGTDNVSLEGLHRFHSRIMMLDFKFETIDAPQIPTIELDFCFLSLSSKGNYFSDASYSLFEASN